MGVRDMRLLESAIAQPQASFGGEWLHVDLYEMAAAYLFHIAKNHPFIDGNKRTALASALVFLKLNEIDIDAGENPLVELTVNTAEGKIEKAEIAQFFRKFKS